MRIKRKLVVSAAGLLALGGIGTGVAFARSTSSPSHTKAPTAKTTVSDTDNVQQGDQNAPDTTATNPAPETNGQEAPEAKGQEAEPANDPEPGHQDPNGANVDHTPAGEQPEPEAPGAQS